MATLGSTLRSNRYRLNMTQADVAKRLKTSQTAISQMENDAHVSDRDFLEFLKLYGYPDELVAHWVERQTKRIDKTNENADLIKRQIAEARRASAPQLLAELDELLSRMQECRDKLGRILAA
jgi:transcriptional regulator with XRE-family HTH domain